MFAVAILVKDIHSNKDDNSGDEESGEGVKRERGLL